MSPIINHIVDQNSKNAEKREDLYRGMGVQHVKFKVKLIVHSPPIGFSVFGFLGVSIFAIRHISYFDSPHRC